MGREWVVEAHGCAPAALADLTMVRALFERILEDLRLHPVADAMWHTFPAPGGITGMCLLAESHLTCHTFPEHGSLCLNLFCCTPRDEWDFDGGLGRLFGAELVTVRSFARPYGVQVPVP